MSSWQCGAQQCSLCWRLLERCLKCYNNGFISEQIKSCWHLPVGVLSLPAAMCPCTGEAAFTPRPETASGAGAVLLVTLWRSARGRLPGAALLLVLAGSAACCCC